MAPAHQCGPKAPEASTGSPLPDLYFKLLQLVPRTIEACCCELAPSKCVRYGRAASTSFDCPRLRLLTRGRSAAVPPYAHLFPADSVGLELLDVLRGYLFRSPHRIGGPRIRYAPRMTQSCGPSSYSRGSRPARSLAAKRLRSLAVASCHPGPLSLGHRTLVPRIHQRAGRVADALGRTPLRVVRPRRAV